MTKTEVDFANYVESKRANQARETETNRSNLANEAENVRSHQASEQEASRHNRVTESETERSNKKKEALQRNSNKIASRTQKEQVRHNRVTESETERANRSKEALTKYTTDINSADSRYKTDAEATSSRYKTDTESQTADKDRASREHVAAMQAQASIDSATITARGRENAAKISADASKYNAEVQRLIAAGKNITEKQKQENELNYRKAKDYADRLHEAVLNQDANEISRIRTAIEKMKVEVDQAYKKRQMDHDFWRVINEYLQTLSNDANASRRTIVDAAGKVIP